MIGAAEPRQSCGNSRVVDFGLRGVRRQSLRDPRLA